MTLEEFRARLAKIADEVTMRYSDEEFLAKLDALREAITEDKSTQAEKAKCLVEHWSEREPREDE